MKPVVRKQLAPREATDREDNFLDPNLVNVIPLSSLNATSSSTSSSYRRADYDNDRSHSKTTQLKSLQGQDVVPRGISTKKRLTDDLVVEHIAPKPSNIDGTDNNSSDVSKKWNGKDKYEPEGMHAAVPETVGTTAPVSYNRRVQSRLMQQLSKNQSQVAGLQQKKQYNVHNEAFYGMEASEAAEAVKATADPKYAYLFNGFKPGKGVKFMGRKSKFVPKTKPQSERDVGDVYERPSFSGAKRGALDDKMLDSLVKTRKDRFDKMMRPKLDESSYEPLSPTESEMDALESDPPLTKKINETFIRLLKEVHVTSEQRINELSSEMKKVFEEYAVPSAERKVLFEEQLQKLIREKNWKAIDVTTAVCHAATASSEPLVSIEMNEKHQEFFCMKSNCHLSYPKEKFPCSGCSQKFTTVVDRYVHEKDHHGRVNQSQFPCPVPSCRETFNMNPNALRTHFYSNHLCVDEHDECSFGCKVLIPKTHSRSMPDHVYSVHACQVCNDVLSCPLSEHMVTFHDSQYGKSSSRSIPTIPLDPDVNLRTRGMDDSGTNSTYGHSVRSRNSRFNMYNNDIPFSNDLSPPKSFPDIAYGSARNKNMLSVDNKNSSEGKDVLQDYLTQARAVSTINNNLIENAKNILEKQPIFESEYNPVTKRKAATISISLNRDGLDIDQDLDGDPMLEPDNSRNEEQAWQKQKFKSTFKDEPSEWRVAKTRPIELVSEPGSIEPGSSSTISATKNQREKMEKFAAVEYDVIKLAENRRHRSSNEKQDEDDKKHRKHSISSKKRKIDPNYGSCSNDGKKTRKRSRSRDSESPRSNNGSDYLRKSDTSRKHGKRSKSRHRSASRERRSRSQKRSRSRSKGRSPRKRKIDKSDKPRGENRTKSRSKSTEGKSDEKHRIANQQKDKPKLGFFCSGSEKADSNSRNDKKSSRLESFVDEPKSQSIEKGKHMSPSKPEKSVTDSQNYGELKETSKIDVNNLVIDQGVLEALNTISKCGYSQDCGADKKSQNVDNDLGDLVNDELDGLLELGNSSPVSGRAISPISEDELSRSPASLPEFELPHFTFQEKSKWARCRICNYSCPQNGGFECSLCQDSKFVLISDMLLHVKSAHILAVKLPDKVDCDFCGTVFDDVDNFDKHLKEKHLCTDKHVQCSLGCNGLFTERAITFHAQQKHNVAVSSLSSTVRNRDTESGSQKDNSVTEKSNPAMNVNSIIKTELKSNEVSAQMDVAGVNNDAEKSSVKRGADSVSLAENNRREREIDTEKDTSVIGSSKFSEGDLLQPSDRSSLRQVKHEISVNEQELPTCQSQTWWSKEPDMATDAVEKSADKTDVQESRPHNQSLHPKLNLKIPKRASRFSDPPKSINHDSSLLVTAGQNQLESQTATDEEESSSVTQKENTSDKFESNLASIIPSDVFESQAQPEIDNSPSNGILFDHDELEKSSIDNELSSKQTAKMPEIDNSSQEQINLTQKEDPPNPSLFGSNGETAAITESEHVNHNDVPTPADNVELYPSDASTEPLEPSENQDENFMENESQEQDGVLDLSCSSLHNSNDETVNQDPKQDDQNIVNTDNDPDIIFVGQCLDLTAVVYLGKIASVDEVVCKKEPTDDSDSYISRSSDSQESRSPNKVLVQFEQLIATADVAFVLA